MVNNPSEQQSSLFRLRAKIFVIDKSLIGIWLVLLTIVPYLLAEVLPQQLDKTNQKTAYLYLLSYILAGLLGRAYYCFLDRKRFNPNKFIFDPAGSGYRKKGKPFLYCPNCFIEKIESPMSMSEDGFRCLRHGCRHFSANPTYKNTFDQMKFDQ